MQVVSRDDFPVLQRHVSGRPIVYLDSAATALKPTTVIERERLYSTHFTANIHRGNHLLSEEASEAYERARGTLADFLGVAPAQVVFVRNATEAINLVASGLRLPPGAGVLVPSVEHHSNIVPWMRAARVEWLDQDACEPLEGAQVAAALDRSRAQVLAFAYASNVAGTINPVREICDVARGRGVLTCVDASQAAAHLPMTFDDLGCDFMAFSGHKMMGPTGTGVLVGTPAALDRLEPLIVGGGGIHLVTRTGYTLKELPYRLEAGTPNIAGALGLAAAVDYLRALEPAAVAAHQASLATRLHAVLESLPASRRLMARRAPSLPIASVAFDGHEIRHTVLAAVLSDSFGVMVRAGFHCTHPLYDDLHMQDGAVRISAYLYNDLAELDYAGQSIRSALTQLGRAGG